MFTPEDFPEWQATGAGRPTMSIIAHVDPDLKRWIKARAASQGISQQRLVESVLHSYRLMVEAQERRDEQL